MDSVSQIIFVVLKGAAFGLTSLILAGVVAFFGWLLFTRFNLKHAGLWAGVVALLFLGGLLYFGDGRTLMQLSTSTENSGGIAPGVDKADLWFDFTANAISGVIGIFAGLGFRARYWPAQGNTAT